MPVKKQRKKKTVYETEKIIERLMVMGIRDSVEATIAKRHGVNLRQVFGKDATRSAEESRARGHVFYVIHKKFGWSAHSIAKWFGTDYSNAYRCLKYEEERYGNKPKGKRRSLGVDDDGTVDADDGGVVRGAG